MRIDGTVRRVVRKLRGTIVDWNPVDRVYTVAFEGLDSPMRMYQKDIGISNVQDVDPPPPPPPSLPASRDRAAVTAGLRASLAAEQEEGLDPNDLVPYRRYVPPDAPHTVVVGIPVYGPYLGVSVV